MTIIRFQNKRPYGGLKPALRKTRLTAVRRVETRPTNVAIRNGTIRDWQVIIPDFGIVRGPFQVTSLEFSGRHDGEVNFELALESAGVLTFTAI